MKVKVYPQPLSGTIIIPGSKSLTHRALICASLANGITSICHPLMSDDTLATIKCLQALGVKILIEEMCIKVCGVNKLIIQDELDAYESASTLRFLLPLISLWNHHFTIKASPRLLKRIDTADLHALKGLKIKINENDLEVEGKLEFPLYLKDDITTQWISGLLFTLPFNKGQLYVNKLNNQYILMTMDMMKEFNVVIKKNNNILSCDETTYLAKDIDIEGDYSHAAFFLTSAIFNRLKVKGLKLDSLQGDRVFLMFLEKMGLKWQDDDGVIVSHNRPLGNQFDLSLNPDLAPILAALASVSKGTSILTGLNKLKYKESDRLLSTFHSLQALGAKIKIENDNLIIEGQEYLPGGTLINGFNDHRIIMSLVAISSQVITPFIITDAEAVSKSFPDFFERFAQLGGKYEYQI